MDSLSPFKCFQRLKKNQLGRDVIYHHNADH
jgi:hypothetical protein